MRMPSVLQISKLIAGAALAAAVVVLAAPAAFADSRDRANAIDRTEAAQLRAIENGRTNGSLTRREYRGLLTEQQRIGDLERRAKADGRISRREFNEIRAAQNDAGQHIKDDAANGKISFVRRWFYRHR